MQFVGQTHILNVPLPSATVTRAELQRLFEEAYFARFKVSLPEIRANLVNLNSSVIGVRDRARPVDADRPGGTRSDAGRRTQRKAAGLVRRRAGGTRRSMQREKLPLDAVIDGPAILEQMDATTVLEPGDRRDIGRGRQYGHRDRESA